MLRFCIKSIISFHLQRYNLFSRQGAAVPERLKQILINDCFLTLNLR